MHRKNDTSITSIGVPSHVIFIVTFNGCIRKTSVATGIGQTLATKIVRCSKMEGLHPRDDPYTTLCGASLYKIHVTTPSGCISSGCIKSKGRAKIYISIYAKNMCLFEQSVCGMPRNMPPTAAASASSAYTEGHQLTGSVVVDMRHETGIVRATGASTCAAASAVNAARGCNGGETISIFPEDGAIAVVLAVFAAAVAAAATAVAVGALAVVR
jgi:hypothetical protein